MSSVAPMDASEVMAAYAGAWQRGEPEAAFALYADDVTMRLPGRGSLAGEHHGRQAVIAAIEALLARTSGDAVEVTVIDRLVSEDRVALVVREAVHRGDERLELERVNLYRVVDGTITDITIFEADQYEVDEFFG